MWIACKKCRNIWVGCRGFHSECTIFVALLENTCTRLGCEFSWPSACFRETMNLARWSPRKSWKRIHITSQPFQLLDLRIETMPKFWHYEAEWSGKDRKGICSPKFYKMQFHFVNRPYDILSLYLISIQLSETLYRGSYLLPGDAQHDQRALFDVHAEGAKRWFKVAILVIDKTMITMTRKSGI